MSWGMFSVLSQGHPGKLDLTDDQRVALKALFREYRNKLSELNAYKTEAVAGRTELTFDDLQELEDPKVNEAADAMRKETLAQAKSLLLPHQLELAMTEVLLGRVKRYGISGLLTTEDVDIGIEKPVPAVVETVIDEQKASQDEIEDLLREFAQVREEYKKKVVAIQRRQLEKSLILLGEDGQKIQALLDDLEKDEE